MEEPNLSPPNPCLFAIVVEGGIGLVAIGLGWLIGDPPAERIAWNVQAALWALSATLPLVGVMWLCLRSPWPPLRELLELVRGKILPVFARSRVWEFAIIAAFAGFGEELLFRGVIQTCIAQWFVAPAGMIVGLFVASVLFGALHWLTFTYAVLATAIGLYLGGLWIVTGNLLVPALVHGLYDFWALVYLTRTYRPDSDRKSVV